MEAALKKGFSYKPLTADCWADFETVMGERGGSAGCWCMWNRLPKKEFDEGKGEANKTRMREIVEYSVPGIILYYENEPVGWLSLVDRDKAVALNRSKIYARIDNEPVVSITCIFARKGFVGKGITEQLLIAAIDYARNNGIKILEGYPLDTKGKKTIANFVYSGFYSTYIKVGFEEVARRSDSKPIMRFYNKEGG